MTQHVKWMKVYSFNNTSLFLQGTESCTLLQIVKMDCIRLSGNVSKEVTTPDEIPTEVNDLQVKKDHLQTKKEAGK